MSRATIGRPAGLDWVQTCVFKAACDVAMDLWERRLTLDRVEARLAVMGIRRAAIHEALEPLDRHGYVYADDAPGNPQIVLLVTDKAIEEYCYRFVATYGRARLDVLRLVCQDLGCDVHEMARRTGHAPLLIEHVLDVAQRESLLRVSKQGQYIVVTEVKPQLRRMVSGAA
jgi:hypothetical protein